ncbi:MAG TPA: hypothetical protein VHW25_02865 [Steroidobacteraceae bacterium]|nr:hypothetical protein [Steroidobacteraceae bacterium]
MKAAYHHFARVNQVVMHSGHYVGLESTDPVRCFQLTSKMGLFGGECSHREETILELAAEEWSVLPIPFRPALSVQQLLDSFDDFRAAAEEYLQKFDMRLEWHLARTCIRHNLPHHESEGKMVPEPGPAGQEIVRAP